MNIQEIMQKYLGDSEFTKRVNAGRHAMKAAGETQSKTLNRSDDLKDYVALANSKLHGSGVSIFELSNSGNIPKYGVNWSAKGTVSPSEALLFAKKIQEAVDIIRKAPRPPVFKKRVR